MPLKKGSSRKTVSTNIKEMVDSYKDSGSIGNSKPANKKKAVKQATAIALKKAGKSRASSSKKGAAAKKSGGPTKTARGAKRKTTQSK